MEPAGSHGVWGLDDYHCLPFLLGSAQLMAPPEPPPGPPPPGQRPPFPPAALALPSCVCDPAALAAHRHASLYLDAIACVVAAKTGAPFSETSPMLHGLAALPSWRKVNAGLLKLFQAEVLDKFPVIQHFKFGSLLPAAWASAAVPAAAPPAPIPGVRAPPLNLEGTVAPWAKQAR